MSQAVEIRRAARPTATALCFAGTVQDDCAPMAELAKTLTDANANCLIVRDPAAAWFQSGAPGLGRTVEELAARLKSLTVGLGANLPLVTLGGDMGGYGAILFGVLLRARKALAFGPQSVIDAKLRARFGDERWAEAINRISRISHGDLALLPFNLHTQVKCWFGQVDAIDVKHCDWLRNRPGVALTLVPACGHNVLGFLREKNQLHPLLKTELAALAGTAPAPAPAVNPYAGGVRGGLIA